MSNKISTLIALILFQTVMLGSVPTVHGQEQQLAQAGQVYSEDKREEANSGTVSIVTYFEGTYSRMGADLAYVLDHKNDLRILAIMGTGSRQNIEDVLYLKGVDLAMIQFDVLGYMAKVEHRSDVERRIAYITRLFNEEFQLLARPEIKSIEDLRGKKVSFSQKNSGSRVTTFTVFQRLGIQVEEVNYDDHEALAKMKSGEIAAMAVVDGPGVPAFAELDSALGFHFVPVPYDASLQDTYLPTKFTHDSYPNLIPAGSEVATIATPTVLIAYNWPENTARYNKVARFVTTFFDNFSAFHEDTRNPKWKEVVLSASVQGWPRFKAAQDWLDAHANATVIGQAPDLQEFEKFLKAVGIHAKLNETQQAALYEQFLQWRRQNQ